jgi:DNA-binding transcriptional ArsR family regulator
MTLNGKGSGRSGIYLISTPRQLDVLSSPVRGEIIEVMTRLGECTIAQIAERMERSAESLYHHMKQLRRIGIVRVVERRKGKRQLERVFALEATDFRIDDSQRSAAFRRALLRMSRTHLQLAMRQMEASIDRNSQKLDGPWATHRVGRDLVSLSGKSLAELNRRLTELHVWLGEVDDPEAPNRIALTMAMCEVE